MVLLGLDIGTSGCKAGLYNENGVLIDLAYQEYPLIFPDKGRVEMDIQRVRKAVRKVIKSVCANGLGQQVEAIGITSLGDVVTAVDGTGKAIHNTIVDFDPRGKQECQELIDQIGLSRLYEITGIPPVWMNGISKIMWLLKSCPEVREKLWKFLCFEELAMIWLGAEPAIDYSLASRIMAFDLQKKVWSPEILEVAGITSENFAKPVPSGQAVGKVGKKEAKALGLREGTPIVSGAHDWVCAMLNAGVVTEDRSVADVTGSMEGILLACQSPLICSQALETGVSTYFHAIPNTFVALGYLSTAGVILRWYRDNLAGEDQFRAKALNRNSYEVIIEEAFRCKPSLLVFPFFSGSGTPYFDPNQTGSILGLTLDISRHQIARAILEGLAYELRMNLENFQGMGREIEEIWVVGGGAKSRSWLQLKADVTGCSVKAPRETEASCRGAALLAGFGIGKILRLEDGTKKWLEKVDVFEPDIVARHTADKTYIKYLNIRSSLRELNRYLVSEDAIAT